MPAAKCYAESDDKSDAKPARTERNRSETGERTAPSALRKARHLAALSQLRAKQSQRAVATKVELAAARLQLELSELQEKAVLWQQPEAKRQQEEEWLVTARQQAEARAEAARQQAAHEAQELREEAEQRQLELELLEAKEHKRLHVNDRPSRSRPPAEAPRELPGQPHELSPTQVATRAEHWTDRSRQHPPLFSETDDRHLQTGRVTLTVTGCTKPSKVECNKAEERPRCVHATVSTAPARGEAVSLKEIAATKVTPFTGDDLCAVCEQEHDTRSCDKFRALTVSERAEIAGRRGLCFLCLTRGHISTTCPAEVMCKREHCGGRHCTLLHNAGRVFPRADDANSAQSSLRQVGMVTAESSSQVRLQVCKITVNGPSGRIRRADADETNECQVQAPAVSSCHERTAATCAVVSTAASDRPPTGESRPGKVARRRRRQSPTSSTADDVTIEGGLPGNRQRRPPPGRPLGHADPRQIRRRHWHRLPGTVSGPTCRPHGRRPWEPPRHRCRPRTSRPTPQEPSGRAEWSPYMTVRRQDCVPGGTLRHVTDGIWIRLQIGDIETGPGPGHLRTRL